MPFPNVNPLPPSPPPHLPGSNKPNLPPPPQAKTKIAEKPVAEKDESVLYGNKEGLDRRTLKLELGSTRGTMGNKIYEAQRSAGLRAMKPEERKTLIEKYFPKAYGGMISKKEMSQGLDIAERRGMIGKSTPERLKMKKEIKFLKKIGGMK